MGGRKGVVDIKIAEIGQRARETRIVCLLARMEAQILQQRHLARAKPPHRRAGGLADAIRGEDHVLATKRPAQRRRERRKRQSGRAPAPGPAEMRHHHHRGAPGTEFPDGRNQPVDPGRVAYRAIAQRHVEIGAQQDPLAGDIEVFDRGRHHGLSRV